MTLTSLRPNRSPGAKRSAAEHEVPPERAAERYAYPRLARRVTVLEPLEEGSPWIVRRGDQYIRVGADMARLLSTMDGVSDHAGLAGKLGGAWKPELVAAATKKLHKMGLVDDGRRFPRRHRKPRDLVKFVPPLTIQLTLFRPERLMGALEPMIRFLARPFFGVLAALVVFGGLFALSLQAPDLSRTLGSPVPLPVILGLVVGTALATMLHEFGHGATLTYYGGRPNRMGFMLFYMSPAFFCDVSDSWRLPHKDQRTRIALAGIITQVITGASLALAALAYREAYGTSTLYTGLLVLSVSTLLTCFFNFVPFVKLDGYLALMSHVDVSHLRDQAMADARRAVGKLLFGGTYPRQLPQFRWAIPYGLVCIVFPLYLVGMAATLWSDVLQALGLAGGLLVASGIAFLLYRLYVSARRMLREARMAGARPGRVYLMCGLVVAGVAAALTFVKVPYTVVGGFVTDDRGQLTLVINEASDVDAVGKDTSVRLQRLGVILREEVGSATVTSETARSDTAPFSAFVPLEGVDEVPMPVRSFPLATDGEAPGEHTGMATVEAGQRPLGAWIYHTYLAPALSPLLP